MRKRHIEEILSDKFDIPLEGIASVPNAQLIGNSQLNIDGCIGIKKYEPDEIIIKAKDYIITVSGSSLSMLTFSQGRVSVRGLIFSYAVRAVGKYE
ncbi:MAG: YabP/YqfC family sporulation protein [Eubacteriales bacterium]